MMLTPLLLFLLQVLIKRSSRAPRKRDNRYSGLHDVHSLQELYPNGFGGDSYKQGFKVFPALLLRGGIDSFGGVLVGVPPKQELWVLLNNPVALMRKRRMSCWMPTPRHPRCAPTPSPPNLPFSASKSSP